MLAAANGNAGDIIVGGGTLLSAGSLSCGNVSVAAAPRSAVYAARAAATVAAGGILQGGYASAGNLSFAALSLNGGTLNLMPAAGSAATIAVSGALTIGGTETVNMSNSSPLPAGNYSLVSYGSIGGAVTAAFALGSVPAQGSSRQRSYALDTSHAAYLSLNVIADSPIWTGTASSAWDTSSVNWKLASNGSPSTYIASDAVLFDDSATNKSVAINAGNIAPGSVTFSNSAGTYALSGSNSITGVTSLSKSKNGVLTIGNSNAYSGGTNLYGGTLNANVAGALGSGAVNLYGGSLNAAVSARWAMAS